MKLRVNRSSLCLAPVTALFLSGCATNSAQKFGMSFLPPAPKTAVLVDPIAEAPRVEANLYLPATPTFVNPTFQVPPRPTAADMRIRRADEKYQNGRRLYEEGRTDEARREFDGAIDVLLGAPEDLADRNKIEKKLEALVAAIYRHDVNGLGLADFSQQAYDKAPLEDILEMTFPVDPKIKPIVKDQVKATLSQLPLQVNDTVLSYINYFSSERGRRTLLTGFKRAGRYKELISRTLAEEGVPQELIYLAQAESGFLPRAVSYKSATGMWQFMRSRGREYGLEQSAHHDDRLDPEKATRSAAKHLNDLHQKFGDWYLAIAAYNCGDGCIEKAIQRTGYADFWELRARKAIPRETTNYVPIIVAMTIMAKNPKAYGLEDVELEAPVEYQKVQLRAPAHLALVADLIDRPVSEVRDLNPALLRNIAPAGYELKIPKGTDQPLTTALAAIPESRWQSARVHRLSEGESAATLARRYRTSPGSIVEIGDMLVVPTATEQERGAKAKTTRASKPAGRPAAKNTHRSIRRSAVLAYR
jgi:membrane-bound lytic murein transglycosylase D